MEQVVIKWCFKSRGETASGGMKILKAYMEKKFRSFKRSREGR
jgi:hypothetical protein